MHLKTSSLPSTFLLVHVSLLEKLQTRSPRLCSCLTSFLWSLVTGLSIMRPLVVLSATSLPALALGAPTNGRSQSLNRRQASYPGQPYGGQTYGGGSHGRSGGESSSEASQRAAAVQDAFQTAWNGYYTYAFPNDELLPVNNSFGNSRYVWVSIAGLTSLHADCSSNGWGASAIDAFSTALVMGKGTVVNEILGHIPQIDWGASYQDEVVSLFETTIRYVGGLLSGYDLLTGPLSYLCDDNATVSAILDQAQNLANNLSFAFETSTGIPHNNLFLSNRSNDGATSNGLATIGSLVLEWTRLSDLTGNGTYAELTQKAQSYLLDPQPASSEPWPGLVGTNVNISSGLFLDAAGGWNGGDDSLYEYLLKVGLSCWRAVSFILTTDRCTSTINRDSERTKIGMYAVRSLEVQPQLTGVVAGSSRQTARSLISPPIQRPAPT